MCCLDDSKLYIFLLQTAVQFKFNSSYLFCGKNRLLNLHDENLVSQWNDVTLSHFLCICLSNFLAITHDSKHIIDKFQHFIVSLVKSHYNVGVFLVILRNVFFLIILLIGKCKSLLIRIYYFGSIIYDLRIIHLI